MRTFCDWPGCCGPRACVEGLPVPGPAGRGRGRPRWHDVRLRPIGTVVGSVRHRSVGGTARWAHPDRTSGPCLGSFVHSWSCPDWRVEHRHGGEIRVTPRLYRPVDCLSDWARRSAGRWQRERSRGRTQALRRSWRRRRSPRALAGEHPRDQPARRSLTRCRRGRCLPRRNRIRRRLRGGRSRSDSQSCGFWDWEAQGTSVPRLDEFIGMGVGRSPSQAGALEGCDADGEEGTHKGRPYVDGDGDRRAGWVCYGAKRAVDRVTG